MSCWARAESAGYVTLDSQGRVVMHDSKVRGGRQQRLGRGQRLAGGAPRVAIHCQHNLHPHPPAQLYPPTCTHLPAPTSTHPHLTHSLQVLFL